MKFLTADYLQGMVNIVRDRGYLALNLLIERKEDLDEVLANVAQVKGCRKFMSKATEDRNIVVMFQKGEEGKMPDANPVKTADRRLAGFRNLVKTWKLNKPMLEGKDEFFLYHVENMTEVKAK